MSLWRVNSNVESFKNPEFSHRVASRENIGNDQVNSSLPVSINNI